MLIKIANRHEYAQHHTAPCVTVTHSVSSTRKTPLFSAFIPHTSSLTTLYTATGKTDSSVVGRYVNTKVTQIPGVGSKAPGGCNKPTNTHV